MRPVEPLVSPIRWVAWIVVGVLLVWWWATVAWVTRRLPIGPSLRGPGDRA